jgi:hypothetical protein
LPIKSIWGHLANTNVGTDCQYKYGDRLPIQIWEQIANTNMGTDCQYKYGDRLPPIYIIWGQIANRNTWGPFYFRDMWPHRSHILAPITAKTGTPKKGVKAPPSEWTPEIQKAFDQMKALMAADVLCAYPDHNKLFKIYTDASNYQLGACLMQDDCPVSNFSRKLNSAQCNYATIDKELLFVVATSKEFRSMLLGAELHISSEA